MRLAPLLAALIAATKTQKDEFAFEYTIGEMVMVMEGALKGEIGGEKGVVFDPRFFTRVQPFRFSPPPNPLLPFP